MIPNIASRSIRERMQDIKTYGTTFKPQQLRNKLTKDSRGVGCCHRTRPMLEAPARVSNGSGNFLARIDAQIDPKQKTK